MDKKVICAALLWLRNHYDVGSPDCKNAVIETIDRVLKFDHPTTADMERFRLMFCRQIEDAH